MCYKKYKFYKKPVTKSQFCNDSLFNHNFDASIMSYQSWCNLKKISKLTGFLDLSDNYPLASTNCDNECTSLIIFF